ncbi:SMI1/KNR4 family protein [Nocardia otitidiscaviarum]|nr:SMI1/KNR4 family protein [Nocardia otitidiscaviarum]MBF6486758.1 SMI1/KNR4 family protein [Nocardia otitidiscaviarum]
MLAHGGGKMEPNDQAVKEVLSLRNGAPNWQSLWWKLSVFSERLPDWLLPVADDEYGNLIAISTRQEDFGSVWQHQPGHGKYERAHERAGMPLSVERDDANGYVRSLRHIHEVEQLVRHHAGAVDSVTERR